MQPEADGSIAMVHLEDADDPFLTDLRIHLDEPWRQVSVDFLLDEVEQRFELRRARNDEQAGLRAEQDEDASPVAEAVVRQVFDDAWSLRLVLRNLTDQPLTVPAARLEMSTDWPVRRWLAGAEGQLSLDPWRADGQLLTFTQTRGRSRLSEGHCWLTDLPVRLAPAGQPAATYQVGWRVDWLRDEAMQAAALPRWWPAGTVLAGDDVVELRLPDAAIEAAGVTVLEDDEVTVLSARPGHHLAQVHAGRGTTDVDLYWADDLVTGHLLPAAEAVLESDPRTLAPEQVFLLGRALSTGRLGGGEDFLAAAVEELAARPGVVQPLGLATVADHCLRTGEPDLAGRLPELSSRTVATPGALRCWVHAGIAARVAGVEDPLPAPRIPSGLGLLDRRVVRAETQLLSPAEVPPGLVRRVAALLGAGLPGETVDQLLRARIWAVLGLVPERWELAERWPLPLGEVRELARRRLLAERCVDEALAWLLW